VRSEVSGKTTNDTLNTKTGTQGGMFCFSLCNFYFLD